jgi:hypothetical protein
MCEKEEEATGEREETPFSQQYHPKLLPPYATLLNAWIREDGALSVVPGVGMHI